MPIKCLGSPALLIIYYNKTQKTLNQIIYIKNSCRQTALEILSTATS